MMIIQTILFVTMQAPYRDWAYSASMYLVTTRDGAALPPSTSVEGFPVLIRLRSDTFPFGQAAPNGRDFRVTDAMGSPLALQIESWDAESGHANVWVRIPRIQGDTRQEIKLFWGHPSAPSASLGSRVFDKSNGFASVLHLETTLVDTLATLTLRDEGTQSTPGIIGDARRFKRGTGVYAGDHITALPFGNRPFTTEAWYRATIGGGSIFYWGRYATRLNGNTGDGNEVSLNVGAPPQLSWSSDGPGGVAAETIMPLKEWTHVAATYDDGTSRIYVNGQLMGTRYHKNAMSIVPDVMASIGGIRGGNYAFDGDIDEVRVSSVARSGPWLQLQYENQRAMQTLVGSIVQTGSKWAVSHPSLNVAEGSTTAVNADVGGAIRVVWLLDGQVVATDQRTFLLRAGRVLRRTKRVLQVKAVTLTGTKIKTIPVDIRDSIPEPIVTLRAPKNWNGRDRLTLVPNIKNLAYLKRCGAAALNYRWRIIGGAVTQNAHANQLELTRSQFSGQLTVSVDVDNGGTPTTVSSIITVSEPKVDAWITRQPDNNEQPVDNQFYPRSRNGKGDLYYNGTLTEPADTVFLRVTSNGKVYGAPQEQKVLSHQKYAFHVVLEPGLIRYQCVLGTRKNNIERILKTVSNVVCGDVYLIQGQSNAEATGPNNGPGLDEPLSTNDWIRSFGNQYNGATVPGWGNAIRTRIWGQPDYGHCQIGAWGMVLADMLVRKYGIPICILNGAVGGTRVDQHQRNDAYPLDKDTIYGRLLNRVKHAKLTHGVRGILWHQGENNQGAAAPTGDFDWKSYHADFVELAADWKADYPNIQQYYVHQIWPSGCNMGGTPAGDMLLEVQRTLPNLFSNMRIMSTLGIVSGSSGRGLCHFDLDGYAVIGRQLVPLLGADVYGDRRLGPMSAPNLLRAQYLAKGAIELEFDQPMAWKDGNAKWVVVDGTPIKARTGTVEGNKITIDADGLQGAKRVGYISGRGWDGTASELIYGKNGVAALAFSAVPILKHDK